MSRAGAGAPPPVMRVVQDRFEACVYRPGQIARCPARAPEQPLLPEQLDTLLDEGDQRVGRTVFRTECPFCHACEPVRVSVADFTPTRAQRRVAEKNRDLRVEIGPPTLSRRRVSLWNRHRRARELMTSHSRKDPIGYQDWLVESCAPSVEVRYYAEDRMVALSVLDLGRQAANSAYHYYDPVESRRSLGVFSVVREIELCRSLGVEWYYLGLWAADADALRYKSGYYPHERLVRGVWTRVSSRLEDPASADPSAYASAASDPRSPGLAMATMLPMLLTDTESDDSAGPGDPPDGAPWDEEELPAAPELEGLPVPLDPDAPKRSE